MAQVEEVAGPLPLADLTEQQAAAAMQSGAVLVLAGAGTGKTKTLTAAVVNRIRAFGVPARRILVVTFTNKAAAEMSGRIRAALDGLDVPTWLGTFHGLAARQLRIEPEVAGLRPGFDILDADDRVGCARRGVAAASLWSRSTSSNGNGRRRGGDPDAELTARAQAFATVLASMPPVRARLDGAARVFLRISGRWSAIG